MTYAGIGSRNTPEPVLALMQRCATRLEVLGYTLRSGGANGADSFFEAGCTHKEIYLPWPGFNGRQSEFQAVCDKALTLAATIHPRWDRLGRAARNLMGRNCYQVLGRDLSNPVDFVLCWTPDGVEDVVAQLDLPSLRAPDYPPDFRLHSCSYQAAGSGKDG
jgi:hypothetical protein